jgi:UDP-N-acetylmuramate--alanine ligase
MVAEADESDGSFLMLRPTISVVTNIDREHMNYYGTMECLIDAYIEFINGTPRPSSVEPFCVATMSRLPPC